jgi:vacuolar-type H+-ATPase subunit D/Vma8
MLTYKRNRAWAKVFKNLLKKKKTFVTNEIVSLLKLWKDVNHGKVESKRERNNESYKNYQANNPSFLRKKKKKKSRILTQSPNFFLASKNHI